MIATHAVAVKKGDIEHMPRLASLIRDRRYQKSHVTIYHESNYHDNRYYHDLS